jgi:hypothetical protein
VDPCKGRRRCGSALWRIGGLPASLEGAPVMAKAGFHKQVSQRHGATTYTLPAAACRWAAPAAGCLCT